MKNILAFIKKEQRLFSQLPLIEFMQDKTIDPLQRMAFAPCTAPFIMSFPDLCKYALRQEPTDDKVQEILNIYTHEDDTHWEWYIADLEKLGFNYSLQLNDSLTFLWGDETRASRILTYELYRLIVDQSDSVSKLMILEAMEAAAEIFLGQTEKITDELELITHQEYQYFGNDHTDAEQNHSPKSEDARKFILNLEISAQTEQNAIELVEKVFELFTEWTYHLLIYAQKYQVSQSLNQQQERELIALN